MEARITANSKDLVYFIKQYLQLPFGPKTASQTGQGTIEAIDELVSNYLSAQPKKPNIRHRR